MSQSITRITYYAKQISGLDLRLEQNRTLSKTIAVGALSFAATLICYHATRWIWNTYRYDNATRLIHWGLKQLQLDSFSYKVIPFHVEKNRWRDDLNLETIFRGKDEGLYVVKKMACSDCFELFFVVHTGTCQDFIKLYEKKDGKGDFVFSPSKVEKKKGELITLLGEVIMASSLSLSRDPSGDLPQ